MGPLSLVLDQLRTSYHAHMHSHNHTQTDTHILLPPQMGRTALHLGVQHCQDGDLRLTQQLLLARANPHLQTHRVGVCAGNVYSCIDVYIHTCLHTYTHALSRPTLRPRLSCWCNPHMHKHTWLSASGCDSPQGESAIDFAALKGSDELLNTLVLEGHRCVCVCVCVCARAYFRVFSNLKLLSNSVLPNS